MILNDSREILSIRFQSHHRVGYWEVGTNKVTKITIEAVPGHPELVPWFAVSCSNGEFFRVNGAFVCVVDYKTKGI